MVRPAVNGNSDLSLVRRTQVSFETAIVSKKTMPDDVASRKPPLRRCVMLAWGGRLDTMCSRLTLLQTDIEGRRCQTELRLSVVLQTVCHSRQERHRRNSPANQLPITSAVAWIPGSSPSEPDGEECRVNRFLGPVPVIDREGTAGLYVCV